jgi:hypothetical protein
MQFSYTEAWSAATPGCAPQQENRAMVQSRIKPYSQQVAEKTRRWRQLRTYRRNQVFGVMLVAAAILLVWLLRTNQKWIFSPGWWRP